MIVIKLHWNSCLMFLVQKKFSAFVLGKHIFFRDSQNELKKNWVTYQKLLAHELKHVEQYLQYGFIRFLIKYFYQRLRYGYNNCALEKEACYAGNNININTIKQNKYYFIKLFLKE